MSADVWSAAHDRALLRAWAGEIADALGDVRADDVTAATVLSVVTRRALLLDLDALLRACEIREAPRVVRLDVARCVVDMAHRLRALGLTRRDVRRLDLGRRRRRPTATSL